MALKLTMDGKELGTFDGDKIITTDGNVVQSQAPENDTMDVPLDDPVLHRANQRRALTDPVQVDPDEPAPTEPNQLDPNLDTAQTKLELKILQEQNKALLQQLQSKTAAAGVAPQSGTMDITDLIGDLSDDEDPHGIARTVKEIVKGMRAINERVERIDQFNSFNEYSKSIDVQKENYSEIFNDPKVGPIAERLLDSALRSDTINPLSVIVGKVAKDIKDAGILSQKGKVAKDVKTKTKVPSTVRSSEGSSPSITVQRPKNLDDASKQYSAWRAARARHLTQGK